MLYYLSFLFLCRGLAMYSAQTVPSPLKVKRKMKVDPKKNAFS